MLNSFYKKRVEFNDTYKKEFNSFNPYFFFHSSRCGFDLGDSVTSSARLGEVDLAHTLREGNGSAADSLAKMGANQQVQLVVLRYPPLAIGALLRDDAMHGPFMRD